MARCLLFFLGLGYASLGGFMGYMFYKYREHPHLYRNAILLYIVLGIFFLTFPIGQEKIGKETHYYTFRTHSGRGLSDQAHRQCIVVLCTIYALGGR